MKYSFLLLFILSGLFSFAQQNYREQWKKVDSLSELGQPKSALVLTEKIYQLAKTRNDAPQFAKALLYKIKLQSDFEEDYLLNAIASLEPEVSAAPSPLRQVIHSVLAQLYWGYYQSNRYLFLGRTETLGDESADIKTWDLKKLLQVTIYHYTQSLEKPEALKATPLNSYDDILLLQKDSQKFRPTLYDFLAHRAVDFYMNSEAGLMKPAYAFSMDNPKYLAPAKDFTVLKIQTKDSLSLQFHALQLMQHLIAFHLGDKDPRALLDVDLKRLKLVYQYFNTASKDSLYLSALRSLESRYRDDPASANVSYEIAAVLYASGQLYHPLVSDEHKWDLKEAYSTCENAITRFPESEGAVNCKYLKELIQQPSRELTLSYANVPGAPFTGLITYRNIPKIYFRLVKTSPEQEREWSETANDRNPYRNYLTLPVEKTWSVDLPVDGDFQSHKVEIKLPSLAAGYYVMLTSFDGDFVKDSTSLAMNSFWMTAISHISRQAEDGAYEIYLADRQEGTPLAGVQARTFFREYNYSTRKYEQSQGASYTSGKDGFITIPAAARQGRSNAFSIDFRKGKDRFATESYFYQQSNQDSEPRVITTTYFFTDRAIYRPGQIVYFKGIVLDRTGDETKVKTKYSTTVTLYDANYQKVSSLLLISNDYGSITGTFTAPMGALTGQMSLGNESGQVYFRVEAYKRPKFEVTFKPVTGSYKLNQTVVAKGKAVAYAGNAIGAAQVKYRVIRQARFPFMQRGWPSSPDMEITNGSATTNPDGEFEITFTAIPDEKMNAQWEPVFDYLVTADVTDLNGETHSGEQQISVGTKSLLVTTNLPEMVNRESFSAFALKTTNLNGNKENAKGEISIWKLREPERIMRERKWDRPDKFLMSREEFYREFPFDVYADEDDYTKWDKIRRYYAYTFDSKTDSLISPEGASKWPTGRYVMEINTLDIYGEKVETKTYFTLFSAGAKQIPGNSIAWFTLLKAKAEPGEQASFLFGTGAKHVHAIYEVVHKGKIVSRQLVDLNKGQKRFEIPVKEDLRGNFTVNVVFVKYNRTFLYSRIIEVPYTNKKLDIQFATFRNKLEPGQQEEWRLTLKDSKGEKVAAEMLATMYDASLDAFAPHSWDFDIYPFEGLAPGWEVNASFGTRTSLQDYYPILRFFPKFMLYDQLNWFGFNPGGIYLRGIGKSAMMDAGLSKKMESVAAEQVVTLGNVAGEKGDRQAREDGALPATPQGAVKIRSDFNETAFFYPQLATNDSGEIVIRFKAPESLTRWRMMGLAYTTDLRIGQVEKTLVTQKDLMVVPNAPRFLREGDRMQFAVKISNISGKDLEVGTELQFFDALTMQPVNDRLLKEARLKTLSLSPGQSKVVSWEIAIPEGFQALTYRITAQSGTYSDGEESAIPVFTNRMLVTESLPLPVNGKQAKTFTFDKLVNSAPAGSTLRNHRLTLEFTSNPAWYAVQALPYLMEYPYQCAEQIFSRYYANSIATHIANSNPKIKRVFDSWRNLSPDALRSNLEKNQELKDVLLEETPWVLQRNNESERKQRIALLFDLNRMGNALSADLKQLQDMQTSNGGWPWFAGMPESRYITQHIVTGLGHMSHLGIDIRDDAPMREVLRKALAYLDARMNEDYLEIRKNDKTPSETDHLGSLQVQYLYARSYFLADFPLEKDHVKAFDFFREQALKYWPRQNNYLQGMLALALNRLDQKKTALLIMRSLREKSLHNAEMGRYWRNPEHGYFWYQSPVETQSLLIEAFDEVAKDNKAVEEMKLWLLKQKQTQDWKTTKATTEAVYALLLKGTDLLAGDQQVAITVGGTLIDPGKLEGAKPEAGTGYFKTSWEAGLIKPAMGKISIVKSDEGVAWGAMYWQYFEQLDKITPAQTPLKLVKKLFIERNSPTGPVNEPITESTALKVGDKVNVRIELRADRDMEYIHLKDMRASAFEPVNVLSGYRYQGGLGYYEATGDASTSFFIGYLPKGTYVFSYTLIASQEGNFSNGVASITCMYAPEFSAHSEGIRVVVGK